MSRIKYRLLSLQTRRAIRLCSVSRTSVGFERAQSMGILYSDNSTGKQAVIHQLITQLNQLGKQVMVLCYEPTCSQVIPPIFPTTTHQDIRPWGAIAFLPTKTFIKTPFDYLYHVDLAGDPVLDYLLARSHAKCRVGHYNAERTDLFEIMVSLKEGANSSDIGNLASQMIRYTQCLRAT